MKEYTLQRLSVVAVSAILSVSLLTVVVLVASLLVPASGGILIGVGAAVVVAIGGGCVCGYIAGRICRTDPSFVDPLWGAPGLYFLVLPVVVPDGYHLYVDYPISRVVFIFAWLLIASYLSSTLGFSYARRRAAARRNSVAVTGQ